MTFQPKQVKSYSLTPTPKKGASPISVLYVNRRPDELPKDFWNLSLSLPTYLPPSLVSMGSLEDFVYIAKSTSDY